MRTILMKKTAAGPSGSFNSGREYQVEDSLARQFVDAAAAEYTDAPQPVKPVTVAVKEPELEREPPETAVLPMEEVEVAVKPRPRSKKKAH